MLLGIGFYDIVAEVCLFWALPFQTDTAACE